MAKKVLLFSTNKQFRVDADFASKVILIAGKRGSGKSHTAGVICEDLHEQNIPFVFFDPQGANKGLASLEGVEVIEASGHPAQEAASIIASTNLSCVIELDMGLENNRQWLGDFLEKYMFYKQKAVRTIFIDEIHLFAPNKTKTACSEQILRLVTTMRSDGIGCVMIVQRPHTADTTIIQQPDIFIMHKMSGWRDLQVMEQLIGYDTLDRKQLKAQLAALRSFKAGECLIIAD